MSFSMSFWKVIIALVASAIVGALVSFTFFYTKTAPQAEAAKRLAEESDADLARLARTDRFTDADYRQMQEVLNRRAIEFKRLMDEKSRIRSQSHLLGVITALAIFGLASIYLFFSRKRAGPQS
ncbi:MAG: hypothetical protein L0229_25465 [Blastocatellia bacterium]|nr:hypothetical protein [Blastocatellia bacterium]